MLVAASLGGLLELALVVVEVVAALVPGAGERRAVGTVRRAGLRVASRAADLAAGRLSAGARLRPRLLRLASGACRRRPRARAVSAGPPGPATGPRGAGAGSGVRHSDAGRALVVGGAPAAAEAGLREQLALVEEGLERLDPEDRHGHLDVHLLELVGVEIVFGDPQVVVGAPVVVRRALLYRVGEAHLRPQVLELLHHPLRQGARPALEDLEPADRPLDELVGLGGTVPLDDLDPDLAEERVGVLGRPRVVGVLDVAVDLALQPPEAGLRVSVGHADDEGAEGLADARLGGPDRSMADGILRLRKLPQLQVWCLGLTLGLITVWVMGKIAVGEIRLVPGERPIGTLLAVLLDEGPRLRGVLEVEERLACVLAAAHRHGRGHCLAERVFGLRQALLVGVPEGVLAEPRLALGLGGGAPELQLVAVDVGDRQADGEALADAQKDPVRVHLALLLLGEPALVAGRRHPPRPLGGRRAERRVHAGRASLVAASSLSPGVAAAVLRPGVGAARPQSLSAVSLLGASRRSSVSFSPRLVSPWAAAPAPLGDTGLALALPTLVSSRPVPRGHIVHPAGLQVMILRCRSSRGTGRADSSGWWWLERLWCLLEGWRVWRVELCCLVSQSGQIPE